MRLILQLGRTPDGRIEGRIGLDSDTAIGPWHEFSGVLELLKLIEEIS